MIERLRHAKITPNDEPLTELLRPLDEVNTATPCVKSVLTGY
jgi:hypothetical protein